MAFTASDLESIEAAIASGARSVSFGSGGASRTVTYGSTDDLLRVRSIIRRALGIEAKSGTAFVAHNSGHLPLSRNGGPRGLF